MVGAQQVPATAAAAPVTSALVPSGIDEVSAVAAAAFSAEGVDFRRDVSQGHRNLWPVKA